MFDAIRKFFSPNPPPSDDLGKLKLVRIYLKGGQVVEIDGVTEANFEWDTDEGRLVEWTLRFDFVEDHREYPVFINLEDVSFITTEQYNRVRV